MTALAETQPRLSGLWRHAEFRRLWGAQTISVFGDQVTMLALPLAAVLVLDASPTAMGLLTAAGWLPHLLLSLGAGVWIDERRGRRDLLAGADVLRAAALLSIPIAFGFGALSMAQLYVVTLLVGAFTVVFDLAYSSYFVLVVPRESIVEANSKLMTSRSASYVAGPFLAGTLVQLLTAPVAIFVDAVSFVASASLITRMTTGVPEREHGEREPVQTRLATGARYLFRHPVLRPSLACVSTVNFFNFVFWGVLVVFLARELDFSPGAIGAVFSVGAVGALIGAVLAPRVGARIGYGRSVIVGAFVFPAPLVLFALAGGPRPVVYALLITGEFLSSVGVMLFDVNLNSIQALLTPHRLRARVAGVHRTINYGTRPLGAVIGGVLGDVIGLRPTLLIGAVGATLAVVPAFLSPLRTMRELPEEAH
jgi:MFS family permease